MGNVKIRRGRNPHWEWATIEMTSTLLRPADSGTNPATGQECNWAKDFSGEKQMRKLIFGAALWALAGTLSLAAPSQDRDDRRDRDDHQDNGKHKGRDKHGDDDRGDRHEN